MTEFKPAKCPSCGGDLQLPLNVDKVKCMYCGTDIFINDKITKDVKQIDNYMTLGNNAIQAHNVIEAINYFNKILEIDSNNTSAWWGKGISLVSASSIWGIEKLPQAAEALKKCINLSDNSMKPELIEKSIDIIYKKATAISEEIEKKYKEDRNQLDSSLKTYCERKLYIGSSLQTLYYLKPDEIKLIYVLILFCEDMIDAEVFNTDWINNCKQLLDELIVTAKKQNIFYRLDANSKEFIKNHISFYKSEITVLGPFNEKYSKQVQYYKNRLKRIGYDYAKENSFVKRFLKALIIGVITFVTGIIILLAFIAHFLK